MDQRGHGQTGESRLSVLDKPPKRMSRKIALQQRSALAGCAGLLQGLPCSVILEEAWTAGG